MGTQGRRAIGVATAFVLGTALLPSATGAAAAPGDVVVMGVSVTPASDDLADGFATLVVDLELESPTPLADRLTGIGTDDPGMVFARPAGGTQPWQVAGDAPPTLLGWDVLTRVSGTPQDGVWRGGTEVSAIFAGAWTVSLVRDLGTPDPWDFVDVSELDVGVDLGAVGEPAWRVLPTPVPVRVVTGAESWTPTGTVTDLTSGAGVPAGFVDYDYFREPLGRPSVRLPAGWPVGRADAQGRLTLGARPIVLEDGERSRNAIHVYARRGSRGSSWEAATALWPQVKWQASQRFSVSGGSVTASGNAWPAPAVYPAVNTTIHLQQLVGRTWRTVATTRVRVNGRYTISWAAPSAGPQVVRVYKPGGAERSGLLTSVGTTLGFVTVATR